MWMLQKTLLQAARLDMVEAKGKGSKAAHALWLLPVTNYRQEQEGAVRQTPLLGT
jgi:hypothetical protein